MTSRDTIKGTHDSMQTSSKADTAVNADPEKQHAPMHKTLILPLILAKQTMHSCMQSSPDFSTQAAAAKRRDRAVLVS